MDRFTDRELTVQENIWLQQCSKDGDYEALILLMESRLIDETLDLRSLLVSDLQPLVVECKAGIETGDQISQCLLSIAGDKPNNEKEGAYGRSESA